MVGAFFFFSWGYLPSYCLCNTQSCFSSWVYKLTFASLYPRFSFVVGIYFAVCFSLPKLFHFLGYYIAFRFFIPKISHFSGYLYYFLLLHTHVFRFPWVFV